MKNENSIEPSDPRLTAYVVGEMTPGEATAFEKELEDSPEAKAEIERIRETADLLRDEFTAELDAAFQPKPEWEVAEAGAGAISGKHPESAQVIRFPKSRTAVMALAAVLIAMAVVAPVWLRKNADPNSDSGAAILAAETGNKEGTSTEKAGAAASPTEVARIHFTDSPVTMVESADVKYLLADSYSMDDKSLVAPAKNAGGFHLAGLGDEENRPRFDSRYLGYDPIEARGRRLTEDPIDPQGVPLPASSRGYGGAVPVNPAEYTIEGLDSEIAEKLNETARVVTMSSRVSGDSSGERSRSLFMAEQSADATGKKLVRVQGRVQMQEREIERLERELAEVELLGKEMDLGIRNLDLAAASADAPEGAETKPAAPATAKPVSSQPADGIFIAGGTVRAGSGAAIAGGSSSGGMISVDSAGSEEAQSSLAGGIAAAEETPQKAPLLGGFLNEFGRPARENDSRDGTAATPTQDFGQAGGRNESRRDQWRGLDQYKERKEAVPAAVASPSPSPVETITRPQPVTIPEPDAGITTGPVEFGLSMGNQSRMMFGQKDESAAPLKKVDGDSGFYYSGVTSGGKVEIRMIDSTGTVVPAAIEMKAHGNIAPVPADNRGRGRAASLGRYAPTIDNPFRDPMHTELSTFSVDVDTASYTATRRMLLKESRLPHRDQVRIEEFLNYFEYHSYPAPKLADVEAGEALPFSVNLESAAAPWNPVNRIVRIALKGAEIPAGKRPAANLVFLLDVSGSMKPADKLPLMQKCLREMLPQLREDDRVTMVVYASKAGEVLPPTPGNDKATIKAAVDALTAKGSTNGEGGIRIAYERARENFIEGGVNRILLATDGDFNVGQDSDDELVTLIEKEAKSGIFLTVLGFGTGNLNDSMLEKITNKGNGQFHYIDRIEEGRRVLVEQMDGALVTLAKDVKLQVDFNPGRVAAYRLIGYANRVMPREDFADDTKDAGEIGAGHSVTALYEVVPVEALMQLTQAEPVDDVKYKRKIAADEEGEDRSPFAQRQRELEKRGVELVDSPELLTVNLRFKKPDSDESELHKFPLVVDPKGEFAEASRDFRFAAAVATFGMRLRDHDVLKPWHDGQVIRQFESIARIAHRAIEGDEFGRKKEFVEMVKAAAKISGGTITLGANDEGEDPAEGDDVQKTVKEKLNQLR